MILIPTSAARRGAALVVWPFVFMLSAGELIGQKKPRAQPPLVDLTLRPVDITLRPDLVAVVKDSLAETQPCDGGSASTHQDTRYLLLEVTNEGRRSAIPPEFSVDLWKPYGYGQTMETWWDIGGLAATETRRLGAIQWVVSHTCPILGYPERWEPVTGWRQWSFRVDAYNRVAERDDSNNRLDFDVPGAATFSRHY